MDQRDYLQAAMHEQENKALAALSRYKFMMFGYHAAMWVHFNRVGGFKAKNPFRELVKQARERLKSL